MGASQFLGVETISKNQLFASDKPRSLVFNIQLADFYVRPLSQNLYNQSYRVIIHNMGNQDVAYHRSEYYFLVESRASVAILFVSTILFIARKPVKNLKG